MASTKKPRKATVKKAPSTVPRQKRAALKQPTDIEQISQGLRSLHARFTELELGIRQLHASSAMRTVFAATSASGGDSDKAIAIGFKKTSGPDAVRVTLLDTGEEVLRPFQSEGTSKPRRVGEKINVKVEVNGGAAVNIDLKNATPSPLDDRGIRLITVG